MKILEGEITVINILQIYAILVIVTFILMSLWIITREDYLRDVVYISLMNIVFFLFILFNKALQSLARKKIRRDFGSEIRIRMPHYWAYGMPEVYTNHNNWYVLLKVIFSKADLDYIREQKWKQEYKVQTDRFK